MESLGKTLMLCGLLLFVVGAVVWGGADKLGWLGRLPGDIRMERPGLQVYVPVTTMILLSVALSVGLWLFGKLFR